MPDVFLPEKRRQIMQNVRVANTRPEKELRSLLHRNGYRFRLNRKDLPGKPDIVLPKYKTVIFVHGCFWHGHGCKKGERPSTNVEFWNKKIDSNMYRDQRISKQLEAEGWKVLVVWECEIKKRKQDELILRIRTFLNS